MRNETHSLTVIIKAQNIYSGQTIISKTRTHNNKINYRYA